MKNQRNFLEQFSKENFQNAEKFFKKIFQEDFSEFSKKIFQREESQKDFLVPYVEGAVQNFIAGVGSLAKKAKEVEEDARKKFCDYPSA